MSSLPEELHLEILKRLSPLPQVLARASGVCRGWRRVVNDPDFIRELYRARHGAPVTMGFFRNYADPPRMFVHTGNPASFSFQYGDRDDWYFVDCRHGRVLLRNNCWSQFVVWHPMTGERQFTREERPRDFIPEPHANANAALLCDCAASQGQQASCHRSPFSVAFVSYNWERRTLCASVFSFGGRWSLPTSMETPLTQIRPEPCAIVGSTLFQPLTNYQVLAFDMDQGNLTMFERPKGGNIRLFKADGGVLGLAAAKDFTLRLWARVADAWVPRNTIDLTMIIPGLSAAPSPLANCVSTVMPKVKIIGVGEEGDVLFLWTTIGIFMLYLESMEIKKVHETAYNLKIIYPYAGFYIPPSGM